jgi:hypothetical protein
VNTTIVSLSMPASRMESMTLPTFASSSIVESE